MAADRDDTDGAARWAELVAHWRAHGPPGLLRPGYRKATRDRPVLHDYTGEPVGRHVDHWDGHTDAHAEKIQLVANPDLTTRKEPA